MDSENVRFLIIESVLLTAPVVAIATCFGTRYIDTRLNPVSVIFSCFIALGLFFNYSAWSWRDGTINTSLGAAAYLAAVTLVFLLLSRMNSRWARLLLRTACAIPILVGLALGTVGILGLMFIVKDQVPRTVRRLTPKYALELRYQGNAVADTDYDDVTIVRYLPFIPLKKTVWHKAYDNRHYAILHDADVVLAPDRRSATISMERLDGGSEKDTVALQ